MNELPELTKVQREQISRIATDIQTEWCSSGLVGTLYEEFAAEVARRYALSAVQMERERICRDAATHGWGMKNDDPFEDYVREVVYQSAIRSPSKEG